MRFVRDHYAALRVSPTATEDEIRRACRVRAVYSHRHDVLKLQARQQKLTEAKEVLCDPQRRREFDRLREVFVITPRQINADQEAQKRHRELRLLRTYKAQIAAASRQSSQVAAGQYGSDLETPSPTARQAGGIGEGRHHMRALLLGVMLGLGLGVFLLYLLQRS